MDPMSALSLAANIVTMVEATVKTGKTLWELYNSTSGFTKQTHELIQATSQFERAVDVLNDAQKQIVTAQSPETNSVTAMTAKQCSEAIRAIKAILEQCKVRKPSSIGSTFQAWFRSSIKHRQKLEELQATLESATSQLRTSLAIETRAGVLRITHLLNGADMKQTQLTTRLETISEELSKLDENLKLLELIKETITLSEDSLNAINHAAILRALWPVTFDKRFDAIKHPGADTFAWILEEPKDRSDEQSDTSSTRKRALESEFALDFRKWLEVGLGVFHIVGKPGCGKSTLMKYLATHDTTHALLQHWAKANGKQLVFSRFFFWKLGTDEQKTMRGLLRGVLYDVLKRNIDVTKLVFPEHWAPKRYASPLMAQIPGPSIFDSQVETAFDRLLNCEEVLARFKICLFIDGLDEFDEPTESIWRFSDKLNNWTESGNVKLCVSSREETQIIKAFSSAKRIALHKLTSSDVEKLVQSRLDSNEHFQRLVRSDPTAKAGSKLRESIVDNAEGVFLWVVLLLKWIDEKLATKTSFQALQRLVETAPQELDKFFASILESIPKHHSRGAYFILAMMLRVRGYCISGDYSWDVPRAYDSFRELSLFGLSYIFDAFDNCSIGDASKHIDFPVPWCVDREEYRTRESDTVSNLQTWCKGLVDAREYYGIRIAMFTHRSVSDFLCSALQDIAPKWNIDDNWIAEGLLSICLAESKGLYKMDEPGEYLIDERLGVTIECIASTSALLPALSTSRIFALLDEIDATRQGLRDGASQGVGTVPPPKVFLGTPFYECSIIHGSLSPVVAVATSVAVPLIEYVIWKLKDPRILDDRHSQLLMLAAVVDGTFDRHRERKYPDVSQILEAVLQSGISPNIRYPQFPQQEHQYFTFTEWLEYLDSGQNNRIITNKSPWRDTLSIFLSFIAFSDKGTVPESIWKELLVWLKFGAEVPADVLVIALEFRAAVGFRYQGEKAEVVVRSLPAHENFKKAARMEYFRTFKSTTMSSMIRWHSPRNMDDLLRYTDLAGSFAEDPQDWKPPLYASHIAEEKGTYRLRYHPRDQHYSFLELGAGVWQFGLSWQSDIHKWVLEDDHGKDK